VSTRCPQQRSRHQEAAETIVLLTDYINDGNGDPMSNGKGHTVIQHENHECVLIPARVEWSRTRSKIESTERRTTVSEATNDMWSGQTAEAFTDLAAGLFKAFPKATGMPLSQMLGIERVAGLGGRPGSSTDRTLAEWPKVEDATEDEDASMRPGFSWAFPLAEPRKRAVPTPSCVEADPKKRRTSIVPKSGGGPITGGGGGNKTRGRPRHDRKDHVLTMLMEYGECGQDEKYFSQLTSFKRSVLHSVLRALLAYLAVNIATR
jgi:hypothetical protein